MVAVKGGGQVPPHSGRMRFIPNRCPDDEGEWRAWWGGYLLQSADIENRKLQ